MTSITPRRRSTHVTHRPKPRLIAALSALNITLAAALAVALTHLGGAV